MKKTTILLVICAFIVIGGILGYFMWPRGVNNLPADNSGNGGETPTEIDTSEWKTYRNEKYGFTIKYPQDWAVGSEFTAPADLPYVDNLIIQQKDDHLGDTVMIANIFDNQAYISPNDFLDKKIGVNGYEILKNVNGILKIRDKKISGVVTGFSVAYVLKVKDGYLIIYKGDDTFSNIQETIIKNIETK